MTDFDRMLELRPEIEKALKYSAGTHTFDDVVELVQQAKMQFWPGRSSVIVTEIVLHPQSKCLNYFLAAGKMDELEMMTPMIESWGKGLGCTRVTLAGRKGWQRTFLVSQGYKPQWWIMSKEL